MRERVTLRLYAHQQSLERIGEPDSGLVSAESEQVYAVNTSVSLGDILAVDDRPYRAGLLTNSSSVAETQNPSPISVTPR
jgi:hypothetical protein